MLNLLIFAAAAGLIWGAGTRLSHYADEFAERTVFLADVAFAGGPVLNAVGRFSLLAALLGMLLTSVYMVGLLDRRKSGARQGIDSLTVLVLYAGGLLLLYTDGS